MIFTRARAEQLLLQRVGPLEVPPELALQSFRQNSVDLVHTHPRLGRVRIATFVIVAARRQGPGRAALPLVSTAAAARSPHSFPIPDRHAVDPLEFVSDGVRFVEQPPPLHLHAFRQQRVHSRHIHRSAVVVLGSFIVVLRVRRCIIIARRAVRRVVDDALVGLCKQVEEKVVSSTFL